jgi:hypothetical protein
MRALLVSLERQHYFFDPLLDTNGLIFIAKIKKDKHTHTEKYIINGTGSIKTRCKAFV